MHQHWKPLPQYVNGLAMGLRVTERSLLRISVPNVERYQVSHPEITLQA
jgi:hypothetical protein